LENEINSNLKINQLKIFNYLSDIKGQKDKIFYIKKPYIEDYGFTSLIINPVYFYESQKFNASLNQKITVDKNGNIKNYISHKKTFGNINNKKINDVLVDDEFTKIWYISNDQIEICKECQYRYFCLNFSEIIEKKGKFFKLNYCNKLYLK
jgi:radical SAM protein with 4Fe4S-binding SPASM domain